MDKLDNVDKLIDELDKVDKFMDMLDRLNNNFKIFCICRMDLVI